MALWCHGHNTVLVHSSVYIVGVNRKHWVFFSYSRHLGPCQKTTFHTHTPGAGHSGLSVDVYGPLVTEIASPIICFAPLEDSSAFAVWLHWSVISVSIADSLHRQPQESHLQWCSETSFHFSIIPGLLSWVNTVKTRKESKERKYVSLLCSGSTLEIHEIALTVSEFQGPYYSISPLFDLFLPTEIF